MNERIHAYIQENLPKTIRTCTENTGTLLALPFSYTVPCVGDMFQELYYWDTYFTNVGLLILGQTTLAKNNVDNMLWLVQAYGFMPNGNRTYYLNRSQPPFLSRMVGDVYAVINDDSWLARAYQTLKREYDFWQTRKRSSTGLNVYGNYLQNDDDVSFIYEHFIHRTGVMPAEHLSEELQRRIYQATFSFFESGWDCNSRFLTDGHRMDAVDLNALLYGMERDMCEFARVLQNGEEALWQERMNVRRALMTTRLWDDAQGLFLDRHCDTGERSRYRSVASLYPLFVGMADREQADRTVASLLLWETAHGVAAGEPHPLWHCQWDYPNVWAPLQLIAYHALKNYGYVEEARRIALKFVRLVEDVFEKTGNFWEKYNGETGTAASDEYDAPPMMGWTAGVYIALSEELKG